MDVNLRIVNGTGNFFPKKNEEEEEKNDLLKFVESYMVL